MIQPTVGFVVYGIHKDGLKDPAGVPFVDEGIIKRSKEALVRAGLKVVEHHVVIATKEEARQALKKMKADDQIDMVVLFSGTWVWAAQMVAAIRDYAGHVHDRGVWGAGNGTDVRRRRSIAVDAHVRR